MVSVFRVELKEEVAGEVVLGARHSFDIARKIELGELFDRESCEIFE